MTNLVVKLRKENNERDKLLTAENESLMMDMVVYLRSSKLCEYDIEVIRRELFAMIYEAQTRGEAAELVIGEDLKRFCEELARNGRQKKFYDRFLEWAYIIVAGSGILFCIEVVFSSFIVELFSHQSYDMPISLGFILSSVLCTAGAALIYSCITKYSFELSGKGLTSTKVVLLVSTALIFSGSVALKVFFNDIRLGQLHIFIPVVSLASAFLLIKILDLKHANRIARTHH